uniref:Ig-like domain-containing protein n=1 Tax=Salmo trutta TaxID=8032 RepID=A0A673ZMQ2_SALTR
VAVADDDVILPCSLLNFTKSAGLVVKWSRSNLKDTTGKDKVVHFYRDARDSNVDQDESYRGRTSLFKELKNGNVSLKLSRVKLSDEGNYMCYVLVQEPNSLVHETVIQLIVVAVSNPVISINGTKGSGVVLKCEAKSWYPKPEMNWLDSERQVLPAGSAETGRDTEGLYIVRRHVTVNKKVTNTFTCRVQLQNDITPSLRRLKATVSHRVTDYSFALLAKMVGFELLCRRLCMKDLRTKLQASDICMVVTTVKALLFQLCLFYL